MSVTKVGTFLRRQWFGFFLGITVILYMWTLDSSFVSPVADASEYLYKARLFLSHGYAVANAHTAIFDKYTLEPMDYFPMGYPLILAFVMKVFGDKLFVLHLSSMILIFLSAWVLWHISDQIYTGDNKTIWKKMTVLFFLLNPIVYRYGHFVMSDPGYTFFSFLAIFFALQLKNGEKNNIFYLILFFMCALASFYIRRMGFAVILSLPVYIFIKYFWQWRYRVIFFAVSGVLALCVLIFILKTNIAGNNGKEVLEGLSSPVASIKNFISIYAPLLGIAFSQLSIWLHNYYVPLEWLVALILCSIIILGYIASWAKVSFLEVYVMAYTAGILFYSWMMATDRYFLPILPVMFYYFYKGLMWISQKLGRKQKWIQVVCVALIGINLVGCLRYIKNTPARISYELAERKAFLDACEWIGDHASAERAGVLCREPAFAIESSLSAKKIRYFRYPDVFDGAVFDKAIQEKKIGYVISHDTFSIGKGSQQYLDAYLALRQDKFKKVYDKDGVKVWQWIE